ncbi:hypothetical protein EQO05_10815 [Methanosarcina sp. MSH10X1]|uniref:hypothetical protein n=1 Tax=Methanosarcina sp. MSH10X1 TaxID=2507075 RepID=UPI000FFC11DD|nr:hypothetical protein [Methanosarcina sp. MSH10X1]RXA18474.1 hypothetical protein EQO05_10815 [Methanosarcina sp. MSH10X1]
MSRRQVFYLRIAAILLVMLLMLPVSVALDQKMEDILEDQIGGTDSITTQNETELMVQEVGSSFNFSKSMLQMLDPNLNLINGALDALVGEYIFLQPAIEDTDMMEAANSTPGVPDSTIPVIEGMSYSLKTMLEVLN